MIWASWGACEPWMASPQPHMDVLAGGPQDAHIMQRPTTTNIPVKAIKKGATAGSWQAFAIKIRTSSQRNSTHTG